MLSNQQSSAEHQSIQKLQQFLQGLNKSIVKQGIQANLQTISNNLDAAANEIGFLLQSRDLNEFSHIVNKLSSVWKELYKTVYNSKMVNEFDNETSDFQQKMELISQTKRQMKDGIGEIGQLGGVRVSAYQTPQTKNMMRQMSRQQTGLPSISGQPQTEYKHKMNYEIDDNQREILQEVLRQIMKRYDPKITLMVSQGTDTNLDIQEAIRGFNKDYLEIKLSEITKENLKNLEEIQKVMQEKHELNQVAESSATEKLKSIYKTIYTKTTEMDQLMVEASKQEPQIVKDVLDDFLHHITHNYKDIQSETFKIVAKLFQQMQQKQKQDELLKSRTLQVQQPQHKKDKLSSSKRGNQSSVDESQISEKIKQELIEKKMEVDKKNQEIFELQNKVRQTENQYIQTALELESMKLNVSKSEQDKAQLNYEFKKLEKQLTSFNSKTFQDQAIQCTDIGQQNLIQKLQKDNQQFQQKVYQLKSELNKISPSSGRELKYQYTEFQDKSDDQNIQNSQNGTPRQTSRYKSAYDFENQLNEDGYSIDQRLDSSQQMYKNSEISNRERLDDMGFERSPTHSNTIKASQKIKNKNQVQIESRQTNSPKSNSERSVKVSLQLSQTNFNPKKKKQKSILKIDEEDSTLNQSAELKKQKIKKQSFSNKVTRRQTTLEVASKDFFQNQNSIKDQDETQTATNFETQRTQSGQAINKPQRIASVDKKNNVSGRRIQTEGQEQLQESDDSQSENGKTKVKFSRSTTQKEQKKQTIKKGQQITQSKNIQTKKTVDVQMIETVEEIPSNITSQQSLDKFSLKQSNTIEETDEQIKHKKDYLKFNGSSPIKRSSTSVPQQLQMTIKLNDEDQQQFTTYWHQRHIDQETQTENYLLMQLLQSTITQLDLPMNIKQNIAQQLPKKLETAVAIALNQSQIIHQTGGLSSDNLQQFEFTSPQSSRQSQESQQMYKNSEISNRERLDDMGFERSPTHSNTIKASQKIKNKNQVQIESRQTNSPKSNSERSVKVSLQLSQTNFNPKKKKQKSILKIDEEDSTLNQSAELKKQKIKKQSFSNKVTRRQTTLEVASKDFFQNQNSIKDQDETQTATNFETQRTQSGQAINKPQRIASVDKKNNVSGRRIQTEGQEQLQESDDSQSENGKTKVKFSRSTTQKEQKKQTIKKGQQITQSKNIQTKKTVDVQMIETVEEIPSNITSQQSLDKFSLKQSNTIEETDEQIKHKKDYLKFNGSSPIKRSSTSVPQQLQMTIKLNDEDQQQFTTYWHQRHIDQETQTENYLLMQLLQSTITQLDLPMNIKQNIAQQLPKKLETAVAIALNQSQIIHQTGGLSSDNLQQFEFTSPQSSRQSQESFRQKQFRNQRSLDSQGKQKLQTLLDLNQFDPPQTKTSLDSKIGQLTQKNSVELHDQGNSENSDIILKSKGELEKQFLKQQEQVLKMEEFFKPEDEDLGYEELAKQIIANENGGQPLEQFKQNDLQSENFMKRLHNNMTNHKTRGAAAIQDMLKRFYKKNPKDQITFHEFKGFYQKVFATHKQCGFNIVCSHLQRFIMKLGFTCSLFSKRKLLKTSLSILKPFNPLHETKQKLVNQSTTYQNSSKFQTNQHFSVDQ
ncbi:unnamed protein product [Paramecium primaurelia]|uniref:EF-hand domain-containing protein n=1 Tax=Paramecium primaurelia TaxID=5886 RepID=A0A8S1JWI1_PARPR|nr:unnamed protein product [Paramecium primaurelia]